MQLQQRMLTIMWLQETLRLYLTPAQVAELDALDPIDGAFIVPTEFGNEGDGDEEVAENNQPAQVEGEQLTVLKHPRLVHSLSLIYQKFRMVLLSQCLLLLICPLMMESRNIL